MATEYQAEVVLKLQEETKKGGYAKGELLGLDSGQVQAIINQLDSIKKEQESSENITHKTIKGENL